jgi:hypothetical protein
VPEIDTSMYPQRPPPVDPIAAANGMMNVLTQMNANREFQSRQAAGRAIGGATSPLTGETDLNKAFAAMAQDPRAALALPEMKQAQFSLQAAQQDMAAKQTAAANSWLAPVLGMRDKTGRLTATKEDVLNALRDGHQVGQIPDQQFLNWSMTIPDDPSKIEGFLQRRVLQQMSPAEQMGYGYGTGGMTVNDLSAPTQFPNPANPLQTISGTRRQYLQTVGGMPGSPAAPGAPRPTQPMPAPAASASAVAPIVQPAAPRMPGPIAGPLPGQAEAATSTAQNAAEQGNNLSLAAEHARDQMTLLKNMGQDIEDFDSGRSTKSVTRLKEFFGRYGLDWDPKTTAAAEAFMKVASQVASQQNAHTDMQLETQKSANPNEEMSKLGIKRVLAMLQGNADGVMLKNRVWQAYKKNHGPEAYQTFSTSFNQKFDPRLLYGKYMSDEEARGFVKSIAPSERAGLRKILGFMNKPPDQQAQELEQP